MSSVTIKHFFTTIEPMNSASTTVMAAKNNDNPSGHSKILQPSLLNAPFDSNPSKTFFAPTQSTFGQSQLWNNTASNPATTADAASNFSSPVEEAQFQLPSFMTPHLYQPMPVKHSLQSNLARLQEVTSANNYSSTNLAGSASSFSSHHQNIGDDYYVPETINKAPSIDPFQSNLGYNVDLSSTPVDSNYASKKRYAMNHSTTTYNPIADNRPRVTGKQQPLYSQYAPQRNPSHGSVGVSSQGAASQSSISQSNTSRSLGGLSMTSPRLLQYQTSQTTTRSADEESSEAIRMELLFKEQVNKSLSGNLSELRINYDKLKASTTTSTGDSLIMPSNFHQLFKDLTRTLNERTSELEDTKLRLEAILVGLAMNKDKTITDHGSFDAQELAHRITNKISVLRAENEALLKMVSFSNKQSLVVELGLLRAENKSLKENLKNSADFHVSN